MKPVDAQVRKVATVAGTALGLLATATAQATSIDRRPTGPTAIQAALEATAYAPTFRYQPRAGRWRQEVAFTFQEAPLKDVLRLFGDLTGKTTYCGLPANTPVTLSSRGKIRAEEALYRLAHHLSDTQEGVVVETDDAIIVAERTACRASVPR